MRSFPRNSEEKLQKNTEKWKLLEKMKVVSRKGDILCKFQKNESKTRNKIWGYFEVILSTF